VSLMSLDRFVTYVLDCPVEQDPTAYSGPVG
jgi:hypothetical protein